jgi:hypothetical protein
MESRPGVRWRLGQECPRWQAAAALSVATTSKCCWTHGSSSCCSEPFQVSRKHSKAQRQGAGAGAHVQLPTSGQPWGVSVATPVVDLFWSASGVSGTCTACGSSLSSPA